MWRHVTMTPKFSVLNKPQNNKALRFEHLLPKGHDPVIISQKAYFSLTTHKESRRVWKYVCIHKKGFQTTKMVYCFAPTCSHPSEGQTCKFFAFPSAEKQKDEYRRWNRLLRLEIIFAIAFSIRIRCKMWRFVDRACLRLDSCNWQMNVRRSCLTASYFSVFYDCYDFVLKLICLWILIQCTLSCFPNIYIFCPTEGKIGSPVSIQGLAVVISEMARKSMAGDLC